MTALAPSTNVPNGLALTPACRRVRTAPVVKLCPNGHENPDDADFCVECAEPLQRDETPVAPSTSASGSGGFRALLDRLLGRST